MRISDLIKSTIYIHTYFNIILAMFRERKEEFHIGLANVKLDPLAPR